MSEVSIAEASGHLLDEVRGRLAAAGLLATVAPIDDDPPNADAVAVARSRAGRGTPLSDHVASDR